MSTTIFEKIGSLIPGYEGYAERESRRDVDKKLREFIYFKLVEFEKRIYQELNNLIDSHQIAEAKELDSYRKSLTTFSSKVKYAPYGASGLFADEKIDSDTLDYIYRLDLELLEKVESLVIIDDFLAFDKCKQILEDAKLILNNRNNYIQRIAY